MKWFDLVTLGIALVIIIIQTIRAGKGMGLILFDAVGLMGCAKLSVTLYGGISRGLTISEPAALGSCFLILAIVWLIIASMIHSRTQWSWGQFDRLFGFFLGVVCAWTIGHMFLRFLILVYGSESTTAGIVIASPVTKEVLNFRTINALFNLLNRAKLAEEPITPEKVLERK